MTPLRFFLACISLVLGAFVILPAPTVLLFQLKLGATELGQWFVLLPLLVILMGRRRNVLDSVSVGMAVISAMLLFSTPIRASMFASEASRKMKEAFPGSTSTAAAKPFSFGRIWSFSEPTGAQPEVKVFANAGGEDLSLDFYSAEGRRPAPCVVIVHGGGWDTGDRHEFPDLNRYLSTHGYAVAAIDYRLAPNSPWPAQWEDTISALRYLTENADSLGIDAKKFVLMGRSAGGQIAETVAVTGTQPGVIGCIALYAPADMNFAYQYANKKDILNSDKLLRQYLGGTPTEAKENYDSASPYSLVSEKSPPTLLIHGGNDDMVWVKQSERYASQLKANTVKHVFLRVPWATHALDFSWNSPGGQLTTWAVEQFLAAVTE
jgi:acetyl esterase/lipase